MCSIILLFSALLGLCYNDKKNKDKQKQFLKQVLIPSEKDGRVGIP
jgi:hypothetical protein